MIVCCVCTLYVPVYISRRSMYVLISDYLQTDAVGGCEVLSPSALVIGTFDVRLNMFVFV